MFEMAVMIKIHSIINVVKPNSTSLVVYFALSLLVIQMAYYLVKERANHLYITLSSVIALDDGSFHVTWGYNNRTGNAIHINHKESSLLVSQGGILLLSEHPPIHFEKGNHPEVMEMIALNGSEIEWVIKEEKKKVVINKEIAQYKERK